MKNLTVLFAFCASSVLVACASSQKPVSPPPVTKTPRVLEIERKQRALEEARQDQKDRNQVLNKKTQIQNNSAALRAKANPQTKRIEILNPQESVARNDKELYAELVGSFDRNNEIAFFSRLQTFLQKYAKSPLADDSLYLAGLMSLSNKNYGPALRYFNQVLEKYPLSNKSSSAMFAKGVALKQMNLSDESRQVFAKVRKFYPGSPDALRAETEMKLLSRR